MVPTPLFTMLKGDDERMILVQVYIHTHLQERGLSLAMLAEHFGFSSSSLKRQFKKYTGSSVGSYILEARMEKAKELLGVVQHTIAEVGQLVGFVNLSHFSRVFTEYHGHPPSKIR